MTITVRHDTCHYKGAGPGYPVRADTPGARRELWTSVFVNDEPAGRIPGHLTATDPTVRQWGHSHACDMAAFASELASAPDLDLRRRLELLLGD